jgi:hypothetical protein
MLHCRPNNPGSSKRLYHVLMLASAGEIHHVYAGAHANWSVAAAGRELI